MFKMFMFQTSAASGALVSNDFQFMDGTQFLFMDGTQFDFMV